MSTGMRATAWLGRAAGVVVMIACADTPVMAPTPGGAPARSVVVAQSFGMQKTAISGTLALVGITAPERLITTPSGFCHRFGVREFTEYSGDITGSVTFEADGKGTCDLTHLRSSGPVEGQVTFQGMSGGIVGHWETNCMMDASFGGLSCDGTMNFRGSGGLEGVQFHLKWGPGWFPFSYTGTAFTP